MSPTDWHDVRERITGMIAALQATEQQLARGDIPLAGLDEIKVAIDDIRLRVWAIMAAASSDDPEALERFRLRRAADVCRGIADDLVAGRLQGHPKELDRLREELNRLARAVASRMHKAG
ncbi:MAG TPA: hypothetical protein VNJ71_02855 [Gemmatimonadales bacterium]|nr:hypothetical protein [Gemmatimonadales bacterium]